MKKVGIITIYDLTNYGNRLQAYALFNVIKRLKCKPISVLYGNKMKVIIKTVIKKSNILKYCYSFYEDISEKKTINAAINELKRLKLFSQFSHKIKTKIFLRDKKTIDYYVCGSDQIWNPNFAGQPWYFAAFANPQKRISYSASFGVSTLPEKVIDRYKRDLTNMQHISVREEAATQIVKVLTGKEAQVVLDPTLMLDAKEWREVSKKPKFKVPEKYLLTYFLGDISEEIKSYIEKVAEDNNLEIIYLNYYNKNDYWYQTGPSEFIWLIDNAALMCTDSFHGSVFSILMESPFVAFRRNSNNSMHSRFESLLGMFKLKERFFENLNKGEEFKIDYSHVPEILNSEREKSINFLKEALKL